MVTGIRRSWKNCEVEGSVNAPPAINAQQLSAKGFVHLREQAAADGDVRTAPGKHFVPSNQARSSIQRLPGFSSSNFALNPRSRFLSTMGTRLT